MASANTLPDRGALEPQVVLEGVGVPVTNEPPAYYEGFGDRHGFGAASVDVTFGAKGQPVTNVGG